MKCRQEDTPVPPQHGTTLRYIAVYEDAPHVTNPSAGCIHSPLNEWTAFGRRFSVVMFHGIRHPPRDEKNLSQPTPSNSRSSRSSSPLSVSAAVCGRAQVPKVCSRRTGPLCLDNPPPICILIIRGSLPILLRPLLSNETLSLRRGVPLAQASSKRGRLCLDFSILGRTEIVAHCLMSHHVILRDNLFRVESREASITGAAAAIIIVNAFPCLSISPPK